MGPLFASISPLLVSARLTAGLSVEKAQDKGSHGPQEMHSSRWLAEGAG